MPGLDPGIHVLVLRLVADGRVKPGHDDTEAEEIENGF
jgi:hypothetical protein